MLKNSVIDSADVLNTVSGVGFIPAQYISLCEMAGTTADWSDSTVLDSAELERYLLDACEDGSDNLLLNVYSIQISPQGYRIDDFARYSGDMFVYFVFPENKIRELREAGKSPHRRAQEIAGIKKDYKKDGTLGELILFMILDGFFDIPMVSHKIKNKQNYEQEVLGSDGVYFGIFQGEESIGIGEAKVYANLSQAIDSALDSIGRYHEAGSSTAIDQELNIAPTNLSDNLSTEQVDILADVLTEEQFSEYPLFHPILICHEAGSLNPIEKSSAPLDEKRKRIRDMLGNRDYLSKITDSQEDGSHDGISANLLFLFLPVHDLDKFRQEVLTNIDPALRHVMGG